ncbi:MAG: prolyl aminopeptidase [Gammaproteobacteria bacterium]|nr:prolyl aminopeptidase [Gammaproteobacteria bacterium]
MDDTTERRTLYPATEPTSAGYLEVGAGHEIYYEVSGSPHGKPVVFLHGGPGGGCNAGMRRFFNPDIYRVFLFDQRGCGKSRPHASLDSNTTADLINDIEILRAAMRVDKWQVFGGSWGSTLALAYAEAHPDRVSELVIRGIFLATRDELDWLYQKGTSEFFPEEWQKFVRPIPAAERDDLLAAYHRRLNSADEDECLRYARLWSAWEGSTITLLPNKEIEQTFADAKFALAVARIETHYFMNGCFLEEGQLLANLSRIRKIPAVIVHGRYDMLCRCKVAWQLAQAWPEAQLRIAPDAGHSAFEPGIVHELVMATDRFAT